MKPIKHPRFVKFFQAIKQCEQLAGIRPIGTSIIAASGVGKSMLGEE